MFFCVASWTMFPLPSVCGANEPSLCESSVTSTKPVMNGAVVEAGCFDVSVMAVGAR